MTIFRNSIRHGTEFYYQWRKSHLMASWKDCTNKEYESEKLKTVLELNDLEIHLKKAGPDYHRLKNDGEKEVSSKIYDMRILRPETEIMKEAPWSRIRRQNTMNKALQEIVGNGQPTGSVLKETLAVSVTISTSVQKWHSWIRLRVLSCSRMREMRHEHEVPEERVPVVECLDGLARVTSKGRAPVHSVKSGTVQKAFSTSLRMVADLVKSALMRITKLKNSLARSLKRMVTKVQWPCWNVHDNWVAYFRRWCRRSLDRFYGMAQTYGNQSNV